MDCGSISLYLRTILPEYPYYRPRCIRDISNFKSVYLSRLHWIHILLNWHSFQESSSQYLQIILFFFHFFQVLLNDACHFALSSKIILQGASHVRLFQAHFAVITSCFQHVNAIWHHFDCILMSCHVCLQCAIVVCSPSPRCLKTSQATVGPSCIRGLTKTSN